LAAAIGAAAIGGWQEGAILLSLFSLSNALQFFALQRTRREIRALMRLKPEVAVVVRESGEAKGSASELALGERVRVRPGERVPADGEVLEGESEVDESAMTGEAAPVSKAPGSAVFAGTINGPGSMDFRVTRRSSETRLARIIELVEKARAERAPTQRFIDQ